MGTVYKRGKNWYVNYRVKGQRKRKKIGPSKELASLALKDIELRIARGEYLGIYEEKKILFGDFVEEYLTYCLTNHSPETYHQEKSCFLHNFIPAFGQVYLSDLSPQLVEKYKATRRGEEGVKASTLNKELKFLKTMFNKALEWNYLRENPTASVKRLREAKPLTRFLSPEEIETLSIASSSSYIYPIILLALNTGMRKSELLNLEWKDIDFENRAIFVDNKLNHHIKNYEPRLIPMNQEVCDTLRAMGQCSNYVFCCGEFYLMEQRSNYVFCRKNGNRRKQLDYAFGKALKEAGIRNFRFHDLRHTFASYLVMNGVDLRTVQELLGHKDIKMTMRYSHLSKNHLQDAVENIYYGHYLGTKEGKNR